MENTNKDEFIYIDESDANLSELCTSVENDRSGLQQYVNAARKALQNTGLNLGFGTRLVNNGEAYESFAMSNVSGGHPLINRPNGYAGVNCIENLFVHNNVVEQELTGLLTDSVKYNFLNYKQYGEDYIMIEGVAPNIF